MGVKLRSGRPRKLSWENCSSDCQKGKSNCSLAAAPAQIWPLWKSHQKKTFPASSSPQKCSVRSLQSYIYTKPDAFWIQFLWTDEVKIELFGHNEQRSVWREKKGVEFHEKNTSPTNKHRAGSIMPWACVAASGTKRGNILLVEGRKDPIKYQQILESNNTLSVKHSWGWKGDGFIRNNTSKISA